MQIHRGFCVTIIDTDSALPQLSDHVDHLVVVKFDPRPKIVINSGPSKYLLWLASQPPITSKSNNITLHDWQLYRALCTPPSPTQVPISRKILTALLHRRFT